MSFKFKAPPRHKFAHVKKPIHDGIRFDSNKEARYYDELKIRQLAGEVLFFLRQTPFHLPGGVKYLADFTIFLADGTVEFVDVKGYRTEKYIMKKKLVEGSYPITIKEV